MVLEPWVHQKNDSFLEDTVTVLPGHMSSSQLLPYICGCECVSRVIGIMCI